MREDELTAADRTRFVRNGFVVLHDAVPRGALAEAREAVAETVPEDLTDYEEMADAPEDRHYWNDLDDMTPLYRLNDHLHGDAEQLVGTDTLESGFEFAQAAIRFPTGESAGDPAHGTTDEDGNAHVDFVDDGDVRPFTVAATTYLDDVAPRGGGLTVWPGSHWQVAEDLADEGFETPSNEIPEAALGPSSRPFEVSGPAGTVVLWHKLLVHTGGQHLGRTPRIAAFTRFTRKADEGRREVTANPFEHWPGIDS